MLDLDHTLYLRPAADPQTHYHFNSSLRLPPFIKLLRQRGGQGNYMDLCFRLPFALFTHEKLTSLARVRPRRGNRGTSGIVVGVEGISLTYFLYIEYIYSL